MTTVTLNQARTAFRSEPHKLLLGASMIGVTVFWSAALWFAYF